MCEIQFIKRLNSNLTIEDITEFKTLMSLGSMTNDDAFGIFNDKVLIKQIGKFDKNSLKRIDINKLLQSNFLIGHNRFKTTGEASHNFNNHPFILNDFVLVHNGMINNYNTLKKNYGINHKIETDTFIILWLINHYFQSYHHENRQKRIIKAIKKTTKKLIGSYSVFLYDKITNNIYYFKNYPTNFSFCLKDNVLIGTTEKENLTDIYSIELNLNNFNSFNKGIIKEPEDNTIYLINDKVRLKAIDTFKSNDDTETKIYNFSPYSHYERENFKDIKNIEPEDFNQDLISNIEIENKEIDKALSGVLGYIPCTYEYTEDFKKLIFDIKKDKRLKSDLMELFEKYELKDNKIYISISELKEMYNQNNFNYSPNYYK